ncbi:MULTISPECIES: DUF3309 family protein [Bradyrhizobium]|uniref:DUF3309 family protein n=1 Tax=Bradyrhizobium japonicum TaxID=375 RepID=UPI0040562FA3
MRRTLACSKKCTARYKRRACRSSARAVPRQVAIASKFGFAVDERRILMELILIIVVVVLLFGGGGYWGRRRGHW